MKSFMGVMASYSTRFTGLYLFSQWPVALSSL